MRDHCIVVIGSSAGGPRILKDLFKGLPLINCSIVIIQHMPQFVNDSITQSLDGCSDMKVCLAKDGDILEKGTVYIIPSEIHAKIIHNHHLRFFHGDKVNYVCPAADVTMQSLTQDQGIRHIGIVLTGMGRDGADGICHIKSIGGTTIAQDEKTSIIFGMPKEAIDTGCVDWILSPEQIHEKLIELVGTIKSNYVIH